MMCGNLFKINLSRDVFQLFCDFEVQKIVHYSKLLIKRELQEFRKTPSIVLETIISQISS